MKSYIKFKISKSDFKFTSWGYGRYDVEYTSPITGKRWHKITNDMPLIDATKNEPDPKVKDLNQLKALCKSN